jgi:hypothetical protein
LPPAFLRLDRLLRQGGFRPTQLQRVRGEPVGFGDGLLEGDGQTGRFGLEAGDDVVIDGDGQLPVEGLAPLIEEGDQPPGSGPEALGPGHGLGEVGDLVVLTDDPELGLRRYDVGVESRQRGACLGLGSAQLLTGPGGRGEAGLDGDELAAGEVATKGLELGHEVPVAPRRVGLLLEGAKLTADLTQEVLQALQAALRRLEAALGLLLAAPVLEDARGFLDDQASILRPGVEDGVEMALRDDHVLLAADAGVGEQFLDVEETTRHPIDGVLRFARPEKGPGDRHLGERNRNEPGAVVDGQRHLGPAERGPLRCARENDVLHLSRPDGAGALRAEHPGHGVDNIGLATPVGTDDDGDPGLELERRRVGKGFEAFDVERLQKHGEANLVAGRGQIGHPQRWQRGQYHVLRP